jgi:ATP-binding cassette, subfamily B, bacterial
MMGYVRRAFRYLGPHRRAAAASVVLLVLGTGLTLLGPWPLQILVDHVLESNPLPGFLSTLPEWVTGSRFTLLWLTVLAGLAIALLQNLMGVLGKYVDAGIEQQIALDLRSDIYAHTQKLSLAYHDGKRSGRVIFAINNQGGAAAGLVMSVQPLARNVLTLVGMFVIIWHIDPGLSLVSLAVVPFLYLSVQYYGRRIVPELRRVRNLEIESLSIVHEAISLMRVVLAFGREGHEFRRFRNQGQDAVDARVKVTVKETVFSLAVNMSTALGTALVLGFGANRVLQGAMSIGQLLVVMTYLASVYQPLQAIIHTVGSLQHKLVGLETVFDLLDTSPDVRDAPGAREVGRVRGRVAFEQVDFSYPGRKETLKQISFEVREGELIGIVGPTGAGKTTLTSLIPRFQDVQSGRILLDGHDLRSIRLRSLRDQVSLVLQEPLLFSGSILENIRYGRLDATDAEVMEAARAANAHEFIERLPKGYETPIGERGARLSGGERQRICIARAFLKDAPILILDEPTSAVDSRTERVILEALGRLLVGRTTFLIAHRLSTVRHADRILVLDRGRLVEQGSHDELLELGSGLYRQLWETQMGGREAGGTGGVGAVAVVAGGAR